jgi:hypothetical protein
METSGSSETFPLYWQITRRHIQGDSHLYIYPLIESHLIAVGT